MGQSTYFIYSCTWGNKTSNVTGFEEKHT